MTEGKKLTATEHAQAAIAAAVAEDKARREPYIAEAKTFGERRDDLMQRWFLSLAVGNGAGGVGLTSALVNTWDKTTFPHAPLVAGLWCFAVGLCVAGLIPLIRARKLNRDREHSLVAVYEYRHGGNYVLSADEGDVVLSDDARALHRRMGRRWNLVAIAAQVMSASAFVAGIIVPLLWLTPAP